MANFQEHVQHVLPNEAEQLVHTIVAVNFKDIGSKRWWSQHGVFEKLNMQAIINASLNADDYVKEYLISYNKVAVLIYDLIVSELWTEKVFPYIKENIGANKSTLPVYMTLFHEATTCGLLETTLYYKETCEAGGDTITDLIDYINRKLTWLLLKSTEMRKVEDNELNSQHDTIQFTICMKTLSILQYLTDAIESLPLSATTRMLNTHDFTCLLVEVLDISPWKKIDEKGNKQIYNDNKWCNVERDEHHLISKLEGQVWLSLHQLLLHPESQRKYEFNSYRKTQVLKLRRYLNEVLLDQLPYLVDLQRFLEHLSVVEPPAIKQEFLIEQIPEIRNKITEKHNGQWVAISKKQLQDYFSLNDDQMKEHANRLAAIYDLDVLETLIDGPPICANCKEEAMKRCSKCQNEWYCSRPCQVKHWPAHKHLCSMLTK